MLLAIWIARRCQPPVAAFGWRTRSPTLAGPQVPDFRPSLATGRSGGRCHVAPNLLMGLGGLKQFGEPVSGALVENDLIAQEVWACIDLPSGRSRQEVMQFDGSRADRDAARRPGYAAARLASSRRRQWSGSVRSALPWPFESWPASIRSIASSGRSSSRTVWARSLRLRPSRRASVVAVTPSSSRRTPTVRAS